MKNKNQFKKKLQIGVIGYAGPEEYPSGVIKKDIYKMAERIGFLVAQGGAVVVTGGKGGVMEFASHGARRANGITVGVVKGNKRFTSNDFTEVEVMTGTIIDGFDEYILVAMCDALIVLGGGAGTLEEITIAYRNNKPIIAIKNTGGWAEKTAGVYLDEREKIKIELAETPEEAVKKAFNLIKKYETTN